MAPDVRTVIGRVRRVSRRRLERPVVLAVLTLVAVVAASGLGAACGGEREPAAAVDAVVARVNGREVRESAVAAVRAEARLLGEEDDAAAALDEAIERGLVVAEAERLGVSVSVTSLDEREAAVVEDYGGGEALETALAAAEMTGAQFRAGIEASVLVEALGAARYPGLESSPAEARRYYESRRDDLFTEPSAVDLGAIFVRNKGIAGNAVKRLEAGRPFQEVSRQFSIDPQLKDSAGRLGWVDPRSLPGDLSDDVANLRQGQVSEPVAGSGGVWIFKIYDRRPETVVRFEEVRDDLIEQLTSRKRGRALARWLEQAVERAEIERL